jgi:hypothetical protein
MGNVKDRNVQFNNALLAGPITFIHEVNWPVLTTLDNYTFAGNTTVTIPNVFLSFQTYNGLADFMTQLVAPPAKKREILTNPSMTNPGDIIREKQRFHQFVLGDPKMMAKYSMEYLSNLGYEGLLELSKEEVSITDLHELSFDSQVNKRQGNSVHLVTNM